MEDFADMRQSGQDSRRDIGAPEIPRRQDEHSGFAGPQRSDLKRAVSQPLILGKHDPTTLPDRTELNAILLIAGKMIVVDLGDEISMD
jgi:hypothetical protein